MNHESTGEGILEVSMTDNCWLRTTAIPIAALVCLLLGTSSTLFAQGAELSLEEAERLALEIDPDIRALVARADAFEHLAASVVELPDVQVRFGLMNYPLEHGNFRTEGMTHSVVGVRQSIPPRGLRSALSDKNELLAKEQDFKSVSRALDVNHGVRHAWLDAYYHERRLELIHKSQKLFGDLVHLARTLYSTGDGSKSDILQVELEQYKIEDSILEAEQDRDNAYAAIREYLGPDRVFSIAKTLPNWTNVPEFKDLRPEIAEHPLITAYSAQLEAREAQRRVEEAGLNRKWMVDLSYAYRDGGLLSSDSRSDLVSATVSFNFPIWGKQKYQQRIIQVSRLRNATQLERLSTARELVAKLETVHQRWTSLTARVAHYEEQIIPKAEEHVTVTLESYENQAKDLSDVVQSHINQIDAELKHLKLSIDRLKAWADIDKLVRLEEI